MFVWFGDINGVVGVVWACVLVFSGCRRWGFCPAVGVERDLRRFCGVSGMFVWFGDINGVVGVVWACAPGGCPSA